MRVAKCFVESVSLHCALFLQLSALLIFQRVHATLTFYKCSNAGGMEARNERLHPDISSGAATSPPSPPPHALYPRVPQISNVIEMNIFLSCKDTRALQSTDTQILKPCNIQNFPSRLHRGCWNNPIVQTQSPTRAHFPGQKRCSFQRR